MGETPVKERVAGRALDAEVAEKVMGWREGEIGSLTGRSLPAWVRDDGGRILKDAWQPTTDHAAAMSVVETLHDRFWFRMQTGRRMADDPASFGCTAFFGEYAVTIPTAVATAETVPLAICKAALAAIAPASPTRETAHD